MEHKSFSLGEFKALTGDDEKGSFEAIVAVFGNVDYGGDRIARGAFKRSLGEWQAKGRSIPVLWSHDSETVPIGVISEAAESQEGLRVKARLFIDDNPQSRAVHAAMKAGALYEFSFGYSVPDGGASQVTQSGQRIRVLKDLDIHEASPVFRGMNPRTRLVGVKGLDEAKRLDDERIELQKRIADNQRRILELTASAAAPTGDETAEEHNDNPEPNPPNEAGEEAKARISALQAIRPMHLETNP